MRGGEVDPTEARASTSGPEPRPSAVRTLALPLQVRGLATSGASCSGLHGARRVVRRQVLRERLALGAEIVVETREEEARVELTADLLLERVAEGERLSLVGVATPLVFREARHVGVGNRILELKGAFALELGI